MSAIPLTPANRDAFVKRISAITPDSKRKWGSLEPVGMLAHLTRILELSLGEFQTEDKSSFLSRTIGRWFVFKSPIPWPKGKIKVPDSYTPTPQGSLDEERKRLIDNVDRFLVALKNDPERNTLHPFFGQFSLTYWSSAHGKHFNHHFEQFGV